MRCVLPSLLPVQHHRYLLAHDVGKTSPQHFMVHLFQRHELAIESGDEVIYEGEPVSPCQFPFQKGVLSVPGRSLL